MSDFIWTPPTIKTNVDKVTILTPLYSALNIPMGSGVQRTGKLAPNDDFYLNERHFYNVTKGME